MKRIIWCILIIAVACKDEDPEIHMTTPQMIERWGYPAKIYHVTTADGYILELHRIPFGKRNVTWPDGKKKPVIFMQHGLLCCSSDWADNLPHESAAFLFADAGFDVWMGNMRGNTYSLKHKSLKPSHSSFWKFSWDEMANYDLDAMINYVLQETGHENLYYMGHSQGTLTMFSRLSKDNGGDFSKKIKKFFALAPVGAVKHIKGFLSFFAHDLRFGFDTWFDIFGSGKFLPNSWALDLAAETICSGAKIESELCDNILFLIGGPESNQWNSTRVPVYTTHDPAGTSTQNIVHWMQMVRNGGVPAYDWGKKTNKKKYGSEKPPMYDFSNIKGTDIYLYWSDADWLADPSDINELLLSKLNPNVIAENNHIPGFNHLDFTWGLNATEYIYNPAIQISTKDYLDN